MRRQIRKVAVLGSGVMGSAIAAHFANAGIPSLVLDIVPATGPRATTRKARNAIAAGAVAALKKTRPSPLFSADRLALIETGNLEDDLPRLQEADWVIEVVKEDMAIKKIVLDNAAPHIGPDAIFTSNTSGLSLAEMAAILPDDLQAPLPGHPLLQSPALHEAVRADPHRRHRSRDRRSSWPTSRATGWARASSWPRTRPTSSPTAWACTP